MDDQVTLPKPWQNKFKNEKLRDAVADIGMWFQAPDPMSTEGRARLKRNEAIFRLAESLSVDYAFEPNENGDFELIPASVQHQGIGFSVSSILDSLFDLGKKEEAFASYESWLENEPQNCNGISGYSLLLQKSGNTQKAFELVRKVTWGVSCNADNSFLFMRAKQLADQVGKHEEGKWFQEQLDKFEESVHNWEMGDDDIFDEFTAPKQIPVVKKEKVYPNDPCPCGSGKKYKKCCGGNK